MHEYTAWQAHDDRMRDFTREADAARLAAKAREGQTRQGPRALLSRWLPSGLGGRRHPTIAEPLEPARIVAG